MLAPLDEILKYKHPAVVRRFQQDHPSRAADADQLFTDLLAFFYLSKKHSIDRAANPGNEDYNFVCIMDEEMLDIDRMWHVFLLYTQDYTDFCQKHFGEFLHHLPDLVPTFDAEKFDFVPNLEKFLAYAYDELGEETLRRWFPKSVA